jgi:hypothetical protein
LGQILPECGASAGAAGDDLNVDQRMSESGQFC